MSDTTPRPIQTARTRLAARYFSALRADLSLKAPADGDRAQGLGRAVLAEGLAPLDLALMHKEALAMLAPATELTEAGRNAITRTGFFLAQALIPLEAAQKATRKTNRLLRERNETLRQHAASLAKSNRQLAREVARRKTGEASLLKEREKYQTLFLESQIMQRKLRQLTRQIISAQEEERKEISRELHDHVVQTLVGINVELSALGKGASVGVQSFKAKIAHTQRLVETSVNAVHHFARELRPAVLDDLGLIPALHAFSQSLADRKKLKIRLTAFGGVEALDEVGRTVLFRVAQEALTNVVRHARATRVEIVISKIPGAIRMEVRDNGRSFVVEQVLQARNHKRLGMVGMRERMEMVGGTLAVESAPSTGTTVRAEIPFNPKTPNHELA